MKLLVTGGAGYVGSVCAAHLVDAGHEVAVLDDLSTGHRDAVRRRPGSSRRPRAGRGRGARGRLRRGAALRGEVAGRREHATAELYWRDGFRRPIGTPSREENRRPGPAAPGKNTTMAKIRFRSGSLWENLRNFCSLGRLFRVGGHVSGTNWEVCLRKIAGFAALIFLVSMSSSNAQVPGGSYQASCGNIRFDGEQLSAVCADPSGRRVPTSFNVRGCAGGIANSNGQLVCNAGGPPGYGGRRYRREDEGYDRPRRGPPQRDFGSAYREDRGIRQTSPPRFWWGLAWRILARFMHER